MLKFAGGAYLIVLGVRRLLEKDAGDTPQSTRRRPLGAIFRQGVIVNVLNPKTALFFLAFLPQFIDPEQGHVGLQALVLGLVWVVIATVSDAVWALGAGTAAGVLRSERTCAQHRAQGVGRHPHRAGRARDARAPRPQVANRRRCPGQAGRRAAPGSPAR